MVPEIRLSTEEEDAYSLEGYDPEVLEVFGAREHNLQNIHLRLPREKLIVLTGVSGSGKSSLAFDTLYAEGQRRYLETFSAYLRQFVGGLERPDVDKINGLSPVIAIDQKTTARNPRSTVGTVTELYDFLRLLYARASDAYSYVSGARMEKLSDDEILRRLWERFEGQKIMLLAPIVKGRKGHYREDLARVRKQGYSRARIDGVVTELVPEMSLDRYQTHDIEVVVDRLKVEEKARARLGQSVGTTLAYGKGSLMVLPQEDAHAEPVWFTRFLMDPLSGISYDEPAPNSFSFNSPYGACPTCNGLGSVLNLNPETVLPHPGQSIIKGALAPLEESHMGDLGTAVRQVLKQLGQKASTPWQELPPEVQAHVLEGDPSLSPSQRERLEIDQAFLGGKFVGLTAYLRTRYLQTGSDQVRATAEQFLEEAICPTCNGARLKRESLFFRLDGKNISELAQMDLSALSGWLEGLEERLSDRQRRIAAELLKEIRKRLGFLLDVGLGYLTLDRQARTLSGGEAQRIRLATQIGSQLTGVLYILDEPSIGLHQRDNQRLIRSLQRLRDLGNTVLVVEHDREMMLAADYIVDIGPGAGFHGGRIVAQGSPDSFLAQESATADYLSRRRQLPVPAFRRPPTNRKLVLSGCTGHNLQDVTLEVPLGLFVCVTGVSGSGKSSLINQTLYPLLHAHAYGFRRTALPYERLLGLEHLDKVIEIDQKPIGRTPRSNAATYTGLFTFIRELFTELPESRIRGYQPGRFSFNVKGGRCETCGGAGLQTLEMNFLPDVYVECPTCRGRRYNRETLEVRYRGKSIADVLNMTVEDALSFFDALPRIRQKVEALNEVGLGYLQLGQSATTLSGGEAQRMKIAAELGKRATGKTLYILDEPTTGLHFQDIEKLLQVLNLLVEKGNTVLVIEHNLEVIAFADWLVDIGPEGGSAGGRIVGGGTPEQLAQLPGSYTGQYLKRELEAQHLHLRA